MARNLHANPARMQEYDYRGHSGQPLAEHEALEYLCFFVYPAGRRHELAHRLINHFGDFCEGDGGRTRRTDAVGVALKSAALIATVMAFGPFYQLKAQDPPALTKAKGGHWYVEPFRGHVQNGNCIRFCWTTPAVRCRICAFSQGIANRVTNSEAAARRGTPTLPAAFWPSHPTGLAHPLQADRLTTYRIRSHRPAGLYYYGSYHHSGEDGCSMLNRGSLPEITARAILQTANR